MFALTDTQLVLLVFEPLCVNMNKFASSRGQTSTEAPLLFFPNHSVLKHSLKKFCLRQNSKGASVFRGV